LYASIQRPTIGRRTNPKVEVMNTFRSPAPAAALFNAGTNIKNTVVNAANSATNTFVNATNSVTNSSTSFLKKTPSPAQLVLIGLFVLLIIFVAIYWREIGDGFSNLYEKIRQAFGANPTPIPSQGTPMKEDVTETPIAPQDDTTDERRLVEKILPGRQQVFNISKNSYTYYDAEPLCKAMGAELATYEQVKDAYAGGADWCNYGWVKGQMAVYPTQKDTWEQLQQGPEGQRGACGQPGVNGGFFDNPELRFGVSCYGMKPDQKDHDATVMTTGEGAPLSPQGLEFQKKINKYRGEINSIGILPFSKTQWSS
jgi:predicted PurR-regulated permease PerM